MLHAQGGFLQWYVSRDDGRLRRMVHRTFSSRSNVLEMMIKLAADRGEEIETFEEYTEWMKALSEDEREEVSDSFHEALLPTTRIHVVRWFDDYREVAPGCWFPMKQGYTLFDEPEDGEVIEQSSRELTATKVVINEALPDEAFKFQLKEGVEVTDLRHGPRISYRYRDDLSLEEIRQLVGEGNLRRAEWEHENARRDERIGERALPFPETTWLNSEPLTWEDLRGHVVLLDFWAEWCGPCRGDLPDLAQYHEQREKTGVIVIGVHTPGSKIVSIEKIVSKYRLGYPIVIDLPRPDDRTVGFGLLSSWYRVRGIPWCFVVDAEGKVAGQGGLRDAWNLARSLSTTAGTSE